VASVAVAVVTVIALSPSQTAVPNTRLGDMRAF
jgi:hypothetical protein